MFVIGDAAGRADRRRRPYPQLAPVAMQQGRHVARRDRAAASTGAGPAASATSTRAPWRRSGGTRAVAELPLGLRFRGFIAWLMWLGLHLVYLIGFRNRTSVLLNWAWNYVTYDRGAA